MPAKMMSDVIKVLFNQMGLGLVASDENRYAQVGNSIAYVLFIVVALLLLWQWQFDVTNNVINSARQLFVDWLIWGIFIFNFVFLILLVNDKVKFLQQNWLILLFIVVGSLLLLWHDTLLVDVVHARLILSLLVLLPTVPFLINFFVDGRLWTTVVAAGVVVMVFGVLVAGVDPAIKNVGNGLWWALATVSTVGYGDVVPVTAVGRMIGALLVIIGLGVFVVITANFLRLVLAKEAETLSKKKDINTTELQQQLNTFYQNQQQILEQLAKIEHKIGAEVKSEPKDEH